ncbi:hypothetical protein CC85DRAFT_207950 [Cutaneotrichosporon oleaginosum]|uniref:Uncharacterized protein n=1 Tax=Cutaneotrichosporon oleaginosum TaxID=879819 RepID=A0A0J0XDE5_9TREE|nr:uncharacterized protein CC85DRAFT_207950 [Cutaneotrichosporon oleaginosum]KLT39087.1 hypothetical protein CC85DRAFT_207950 [Cutaneotrichosporon oleaginosum]TXT08509.1 hypothetical protein COLE_05433 [Cutaneotrichosporon oleaginosum]
MNHGPWAMSEGGRLRHRGRRCRVCYMKALCRGGDAERTGFRNGGAAKGGARRGGGGRENVRALLGITV